MSNLFRDPLPHYISWKSIEQLQLNPADNPTNKQGGKPDLLGSDSPEIHVSLSTTPCLL